jgi:hypothetical protein
MTATTAKTKSAEPPGMRECYRSPVRGICCVCDRWTAPIHNPLNRRGIFCAAHCPVCNQVKGTAAA